MASINQTDIDAVPDDGTRAVEFGASLREIRLAHQRELSDVSEDLRIRQVFLRAMEEGRFDDLPGPAYAVGFVRTYADYLGLDVEEVVRSFKELGVASNRQPNLVPPSPVTEARLPTGSIMLVAAVLAAAAYGGWYQTSLEGENAVESLAALPQRIAALVGMRTEPEAPEAPEASQPSPAAAIEPATEPGDTTAREYPPGTGAEPDPQPATGGDGAAAAPATTETAPQAEPSAAPAEPPAAPPAAPMEPSATQATGGDAEPAQGDADSEPAEAAARSAAAPETSVPEPPAAAPEVISAAATQTPPPQTPRPTAPETVEAAAQPKPPQAAEKREPAPMTAMAAEPAAGADVASGAPTAPAQDPAASPPAPVSTAPPAAETAETPAAAQQTASAADSAEAEFRVTVRATTTAWVEVRGSDNKPVFSRMMQSGEAVDLPVTPGMTLSTGNAGGIEILVDGAVLPPLGPNGAVRRNVALDAKALLKYSGRTE